MRSPVTKVAAFDPVTGVAAEQAVDDSADLVGAVSVGNGCRCRQGWCRSRRCRPRGGVATTPTLPKPPMTLRSAGDAPPTVTTLGSCSPRRPRCPTPEPPGWPGGLYSAAGWRLSDPERSSPIRLPCTVSLPSRYIPLKRLPLMRLPGAAPVTEVGPPMSMVAWCRSIRRSTPKALPRAFSPVTSVPM